MDEKRGLTSSAFLASAPLSVAMLGYAVGLLPGAVALSDPVRIALIVAASVTQVAYVVGNAIVKIKCNGKTNGNSPAV